MNEETISKQKSFTNDRTQTEKIEGYNRIADLFKEDELITSVNKMKGVLPEHLYRKYRKEFHEKNGLIIITT